MQREIITIPRDEEYRLIEQLKGENTITAQRILRLYDMPDLSRLEGNPVNLIVQNIIHSEFYKDFDLVETPEIVDLYETFDLFDFAADHPARNKSDTYFVTDTKILRTHTTVLWYYYLTRPDIQEKLKREGCVKALSRGKVYRRDEIDRSHYPVFHQIDGLYLVEKTKETIGKAELAEVLKHLIIGLYGNDIEYKISDDTFPYTDPSLEVEVKFNDKRLELLGSGIVKGSVLKNLGIDPDKYNGWAFGPGIERLVMPKMQIPDIRILRSQDPRITKQWGDLENNYEDVSKYPNTYRDISFLISKDISLNNYYEIIRDEAGNLVEEVQLLDTYENAEKFGADRRSHTFRIVYRSHERTLLNEEINEIQFRIRDKTAEILGAELR